MAGTCCSGSELSVFGPGAPLTAGSPPGEGEVKVPNLLQNNVNRIYQEYKENSQSKPYEESGYYWHSLVLVRMPAGKTSLYC